LLGILFSGAEAMNFEPLWGVAEWLMSNKGTSWKITNKLASLQIQEQTYRY
jgi:hypothetical protein